jgi:hypothetical protein
VLGTLNASQYFPLRPYLPLKQSSDYYGVAPNLVFPQLYRNRVLGRRATERIFSISLLVGHHLEHNGRFGRAQRIQQVG